MYGCHPLCRHLIQSRSVLIQVLVSKIICFIVVDDFRPKANKTTEDCIVKPPKKEQTYMTQLCANATQVTFPPVAQHKKEKKSAIRLWIRTLQLQTQITRSFLVQPKKPIIVSNEHITTKSSKQKVIIQRFPTPKL